MKFLPFQKNSWKHTPSFESWHICAVETAYSFRVTYKTSFPWYKSQHLQLSKCSKHGMKFEEWYIINLITWSSLESVSALLIIHTLFEGDDVIYWLLFSLIQVSVSCHIWKYGGSYLEERRFQPSTSHRCRRVNRKFKLLCFFDWQFP